MSDVKKRWDGPLFDDFQSPLMWKDDVKGYVMLEPPHSVTFPICDLCGRVIWDWPHFEEPVPEHPCCENCFRDETEEPI